MEVLVANGGVGWTDEAPYDAIVVTAACPRVPEPLLEQLQDGGQLVLPVGDLLGQNLLRIRKRAEQTVTEDLGTCSFVPLVGKKGWKTKSSWYY